MMIESLVFMFYVVLFQPYLVVFFSFFFFHKSVSGLDPLCGLSRLPHIGPLLHGALQRLGLFFVHLHVVHLLIRGHWRGWGLRNRFTYGRRVNFWRCGKNVSWCCITLKREKKVLLFCVGWAILAESPAQGNPRCRSSSGPGCWCHLRLGR